LITAQLLGGTDPLVLPKQNYWRGLDSTVPSGIYAYATELFWWFYIYLQKSLANTKEILIKSQVTWYVNYLQVYKLEVD